MRMLGFEVCVLLTAARHCRLAWYTVLMKAGTNFTLRRAARFLRLTLKRQQRRYGHACECTRPELSAQSVLCGMSKCCVHADAATRPHNGFWDLAGRRKHSRWLRVLLRRDGGEAGEEVRRRRRKQRMTRWRSLSRSKAWRHCAREFWCTRTMPLPAQPRRAHAVKLRPTSSLTAIPQQPLTNIEARIRSITY